MSVRTDVVNLQVNVNGNAAQNQLNDLRKKAADIRFEMQGMKKGTQEYIDKSKELKAVTNQQDELKKSIGLSALTLKELRQELAKVKSIAASSVPGSQQWKEYSTQIGEVETRIKDLTERQKAMSESAKPKEGGLFSKVFWGSFLAGAGMQALGWIKNMAGESIKMALEAEGIRLAFDRLNDPGLLSELRKATRGTVSDLELMKRAIQANNFQIPLETLGTLLEFAQRRARDTGESVDYLVESIVTGIARKSPLILDNLGISIQRIQAEFQKTGDFARAAMNVVTTELEKAGPPLDLMADRVDKIKANWENFWTNLGTNLLTGVATGLDKLEYSFSNAYGRSLIEQRRANEELARQNEDARQEEILEIGRFNKLYQNSDKSSREMVVANVKQKLVELQIAESNALVRGETQLKNSLSQRLDMWLKFFGQITGTVTNGDTIAGLRAEIGVIEQIRDNAKFGSKEFADATNQLRELNNKLNDFTGVTSANIQNDRMKASLSEAKRIKEDYERLKMDISRLQRDIEVGAMPDMEAEEARINDRFKELMIRAKGYATELMKLENLHQTEIDRLHYKFFKQNIKDQEKKRLQEYDMAVSQLQVKIEQEKQLAAAQFSEGIFNKEQYENEIKNIEASHVQQRIALADLYFGRVTKAGEDLVTATKEQQKLITEDLIAHASAREAIAKQEAEARKSLAEAEAKKGGAKALRDFKLKEAEKERDLQIAALIKDLEAAGNIVTQELLNLNPVFLKIHEDFNQKTADINKDHFLARVDAVMEYVNAAIGAFESLNTWISNREEIMLQKERARNELRKEMLKKQLDSKLMSQTQYDKKVQELEDQQAAREKEVHIKQAKRDKAINIFKAIADTAAAVVRSIYLAGGFPAGIPAGIAMGAIGALQIGAIASAPLPEFGAGEWLRTGPKHKEKGRGTLSVIERDEAVMAAAAMTDPGVYSVTGTTAQITSALNNRNGGKAWAAGAKIVPLWRAVTPAQINASIPRILANGGFNATRAQVADNKLESAETNGLLRTLISRQEENTLEIKTMKTRLHAVVSIKEYREVEAKFDASKRAGGIN